MAEINKDAFLNEFIVDAYQMMQIAEVEMIKCEKTKSFSDTSINEIFRVMHTIKGTAAMMEYHNISNLTHSLEDLFFFIRKNSNVDIDFANLSDLVLDVLDFIKTELSKIEQGKTSDGNEESIKKKIEKFLKVMKGETDSDSEKNKSNWEKNVKKAGKKLKNKYIVSIKFFDDAQLESVRTFVAVVKLNEIGNVTATDPADPESDEELIKEKGVDIYFESDYSTKEVVEIINGNIPLIDKMEVVLEEKETKNETETSKQLDKPKTIETAEVDSISKRIKQSFINVNVDKLDKLMDIVGELVISEVLVTKNPEITKLKIKSFLKASNHLRKITSELQDIVMSIRMVSISQIFMNMNRIVRDMNRKLEKNVELTIIGEETEVDKNVIETISDPLIHLIRNSIDHGIESEEDRIKNGKDAHGKIMLEAKHESGQVWITVSDDGRGLSRAGIIEKAIEMGIVDPNTIHSKEDKEIYQLILKPGFSTKEEVTEYSGRGVGMDVVHKNIEELGGKLHIESEEGKGSSFIIKLPLTLAIMNGMELSVSSSKFTIPTINIQQSFNVIDSKIITNSDGNELIMFRGNAYPILRLHKIFNIEGAYTDMKKGVIIVVEVDGKTICIFADKLVGEHQVVVKPIPKCIDNIKGISGCTILGDGSISLIIDGAGLINRFNL